jgi:hypothetical protein
LRFSWLTVRDKGLQAKAAISATSDSSLQGGMAVTDADRLKLVKGKKQKHGRAKVGELSSTRHAIRGFLFYDGLK